MVLSVSESVRVGLAGFVAAPCQEDEIRKLTASMQELDTAVRGSK